MPKHVLRRPKLFIFWGLLIVGTIGFSELIVRLVLDPPRLYPEGRGNPALMADATKGYALQPGVADWHTAGERRVAIRVNARGFRDGPYLAALASDIRMLAVGDSFTLGLAVDSADPWPEQLEDLLRRNEGPRASVVNAGVEGYSARQMRQVVEEVMPELQAQFVLFGMNVETYWRVEDPYVYYGRQLVRQSVVPSVTVGRKGLYYSPISRWPWLKHLDIWLNQHFELGAHVLDAGHRVSGRVRDAFASSDSKQPRAPTDSTSQTVDQDVIRGGFGPMLAEIERTRGVVRSHGSELIVLLINPQEKDGSFRPDQFAYNLIVEEYCNRKGIRVVNPLPTLVEAADGLPIYRTPEDYHWSPAAHGVAATELHEYLMREELLTATGLEVAHGSGS